MARMRVERGSPLPECVTALLNQPPPSRTARHESFTADDPVDEDQRRKRYILEKSELLRISCSSRSPRDEYLVAYQKPRRRGLYVWEVKCSAHRNQTIQGLVRVEMWTDRTTPDTAPVSGLTVAVNVRRPAADDVQAAAAVTSSSDVGSHYLIIIDSLKDDATISWARNSRVITQERYRCDNQSFYLFLLEIEVDRDYEFSTQFLGGFDDPLSLERLCRVTIRDHLKTVDRLGDIQQLPLPTLMKDFLEHSDSISDESTSH